MDLVEIKFIPTGNIFLLPADEATRIINEDRGNYQIIKGVVKIQKEEKTVKTVKEMVVDDTPKDDDKPKIVEEKDKDKDKTTTTTKTKAKTQTQKKNKENK